MPKLLPPLNALRAFEATARHMSFSRAAEELNVTPAALSHQVAGLEAFLGERLFNRTSRTIALTPAGELLYPGLNAAFAQIRQSVERVMETGDGQILVVSAPPGFTAKWLVPRLHRFLATHPELDVRVSASLTLASFAGDGVDVAIRNARPPFPGLWSRKFLEIETLPVVTPRLIEQFGPLETPEDLARFPIIHDDSLGRMFGLPTWMDWLRAAGEIMHERHDASATFEHYVKIGAPFGPIEEHTVRWSEPMSRSRFLDLVRSRSYFITASPEEQASTIAALETLLDTHPDVAGAAELAVPYVTRCFRARRR